MGLKIIQEKQCEAISAEGLPHWELKFHFSLHSFSRFNLQSVYRFPHIMTELLGTIIARDPFIAYNIPFVFKKVHLFSQASSVQPGRVQPNWTKDLRSPVYQLLIHSFIPSNSVCAEPWHILYPNMFFDEEPIIMEVYNNIQYWWGWNWSGTLKHWSWKS